MRNVSLPLLGLYFPTCLWILSIYAHYTEPAPKRRERILLFAAHLTTTSPNLPFAPIGAGKVLLRRIPRHVNAMSFWSHSPRQLALRTLILRHDILLPSPSCSRNIHATIPRPASSGPDHIRWPTTPNPSPYEILGLPQTASASEIKARYYQLAKRYHPDSRGIPGETPHERLHRFRQVVQANELLSTARRRRIYDSQGHGWDNINFNDIMDDPVHWRGNWEGRFRAAGSPPGQRRQDHKDNRRGEDFRWDDLRPWQRAQPYYTSNANFVGAVIVMVMLFGVMELSYVQSNVKRSIEGRELAHERASANLRDARRHAKLRQDMIEDVQQRRYGSTEMDSRIEENIKR